MRKIIGGFLTLLWLASAALADDEVVIAELGDSLTQGYGLPEGDGLVPQLQAWLDARGASVRIQNAGVSGDTTAGGLARVGWTLTPEVDAMILALGANDMLRGVDPSLTRTNLDAILDAADAAGTPVLLLGFEAPGNYGPEYKAAFDAIYPDLAAEHGAALYPHFFAGLGVEGSDLAAARPLMQADGIHPNAQGVRRIVEAIGPAVLDLASRAGE